MCAVTCGGTETVSRGSIRATLGIIKGLRTDTLTPCSLQTDVKGRRETRPQDRDVTHRPNYRGDFRCSVVGAHLDLTTAFLVTCQKDSRRDGGVSIAGHGRAITACDDAQLR